jgi:hypothetical protein
MSADWTAVLGLNLAIAGALAQAYENGRSAGYEAASDDAYYASVRVDFERADQR